MTGIERLRELVDGVSEFATLWRVTTGEYDIKHGLDTSRRGGSIRDFLADIADQIERESDVETVRSDAMEAWEFVREHGGLATLELHEETFADMMRQRDEYRDLARGYERDATWVRDHGGLDAVRRMFQDADNRRVELCAALGIDLDKGWSEAMATMRLRLMPEGMEWPRSGTAIVRIGGTIADELGHAHEVTSIEFCKGEVALHWNPAEPEECVWVGHGERARSPRFDVDGVPIHKSDTVYLLPGEWCDRFPCLGFHGGEELEVFADGEAGHVPGSVQCREKEKKVGIRGTCYPQPEQLTHTKPEPPDSWERIEEDIADLPCSDYCDTYRIDASDTSYEHAMARDLVRRCRALAERERGE